MEQSTRKREVFSADLKAPTVEDNLTAVGILFKAVGPAGAKALFPNSVFVRIKESLPKSAERNRDRNARDETGTYTWLRCSQAKFCAEL